MSNRNVGQVEAELNAGDQFTTDISGEIQDSDGERGIRLKGWFNISVAGTWEGSITLQRSFDDGENWFDITVYTDNEQNYDQEIESDMLYRIGFKAGDHDSGTALVRLSK